MSEFQPKLSSLPEWLHEMVQSKHWPLLSNTVREWNDETWRREPSQQGGGGFSGYDFCHSPDAAVRILDYCLVPATSRSGSDMGFAAASLQPPLAPSTRHSFPQLIGAVHFTPRCESHQGLCHGGSFCALMDDAVGWTGFCVTGCVRPWSGFTVQVNTRLSRPVAVGSVLRLEAWVDRREARKGLARGKGDYTAEDSAARNSITGQGSISKMASICADTNSPSIGISGDNTSSSNKGSRKFWIRARLIDPYWTGDGGTGQGGVYCEAEGLFLLNSDLLVELDGHLGGSGVAAGLEQSREEQGEKVSGN